MSENKKTVAEIRFQKRGFLQRELKDVADPINLQSGDIFDTQGVYRGKRREPGDQSVLYNTDGSVRILTTPVNHYAPGLLTHPETTYTLSPKKKDDSYTSYKPPLGIIGSFLDEIGIQLTPVSQAIITLKEVDET